MKGMANRVALAAMVALCLSGTAMAGYNYLVNGILVSLSAPGGAYYDGGDGTVTVAPASDFSTVKISAGKYAPAGYADIFINAGDTVLKSIAMKGSAYTWLYTAGQTWHCYSFKVANTNVGGTDYYGRTVGLGMTSVDVPGWAWPTISMKYGCGFGVVLGGQVFSKAKADLDQSLPAEARDLLFGQ